MARLTVLESLPYGTVASVVRDGVVWLFVSTATLLADDICALVEAVVDDPAKRARLEGQARVLFGMDDTG